MRAPPPIAGAPSTQGRRIVGLSEDPASSYMLVWEWQLSGEGTASWGRPFPVRCVN